MNQYGIEFYVAYHKSMCVLPVDKAGILYAVNRNVEGNNVIWFNNEIETWSNSHYQWKDIIKHKTTFIPVDETFNNGYISVKDALSNTNHSIFSSFPKWATLNNSGAQTRPIEPIYSSDGQDDDFGLGM